MTKPTLSKAQTYAATYAAIGRRLRWARELVYDSQADFARVIGVEKSTINKIEAGIRTPSLINLITAANKLRCGTEYLLTGDLSSVEPELRLLLVQQHPELLEPLAPLPPRPQRPEPVAKLPTRPRLLAGKDKPRRDPGRHRRQAAGI